MLRQIRSQWTENIVQETRQGPLGGKDGVTDCSDSPRVCEKCGLTRISHKISDEGGRDVAPDSLTMGLRTLSKRQGETHWGQRWRDRSFGFTESL